MIPANYMAILKDRDTAKPMKKYVPKNKAYPTIDLCPVCEKPFVDEKASFCMYCGQRVDRTVYQL